MSGKISGSIGTGLGLIGAGTATYWPDARQVGLLLMAAGLPFLGHAAWMLVKGRMAKRFLASHEARPVPSFTSLPLRWHRGKMTIPFDPQEIYRKLDGRSDKDIDEIKGRLIGETIAFRAVAGELRELHGPILKIKKMSNHEPEIEAEFHEDWHQQAYSIREGQVVSVVGLIDHVDIRTVFIVGAELMRTEGTGKVSGFQSRRTVRAHRDFKLHDSNNGACGNGHIATALRLDFGLLGR